MRPKTLELRVVVYLAIALTVAMIIFTMVVVRYQRAELLKEAVRHANQLSEVIIKSTRYAMLQYQPDYVDKIIQDVSLQKGIAKVRVLNKDGEIIHSTYQPERGLTIDQKAEGCFQCHQSEKPLMSLPSRSGGRVFCCSRGERLLGSMAVIHIPLIFVRT